MPDFSPISPERGRLFVIAGPSGAGKSTIVRAIRQRLTIEFSVSATTRAPRPGEIDGVNYHFVDVGEFERLVMIGAFLEWAKYGQHHYGTLRSEVSGRLAEGHDVILEIDIQGARQVKERYPEAIMVFIAPPSLEDLERRLQARGDTSPAEIQRRLAIAGREIEEASDLFDVTVVNSDIETAILAVEQFMREQASTS